jgi:hypothetical protein
MPYIRVLGVIVLEHTLKLNDISATTKVMSISDNLDENGLY